MGESTDQDIQKNTKCSLNPCRSISIYIKIFINYAQMVAIIHSLELKWPYYVENYLKITGNVGTISNELISLDCLISDYNINVNSIYLKSLVDILIYLVFLVSASFIFFIRHHIMRKRKQMNRLIILAVVLSIMIQPTSLKETSDIFNCQTVEGQSYMAARTSISCFTSEHNQWVII